MVGASEMKVQSIADYESLLEVNKAYLGSGLHGKCWHCKRAASKDDRVCFVQIDSAKRATLEKILNSDPGAKLQAAGDAPGCPSGSAHELPHGPVSSIPSHVE